MFYSSLFSAPRNTKTLAPFGDWFEFWPLFGSLVSPCLRFACFSSYHSSCARCCCFACCCLGCCCCCCYSCYLVLSKLVLPYVVKTATLYCQKHSSKVLVPHAVKTSVPYVVKSKVPEGFTLSGDAKASPAAAAPAPAPKENGGAAPSANGDTGKAGGRVEMFAVLQYLRC